MRFKAPSKVISLLEPRKTKIGDVGPQRRRFNNGIWKNLKELTEKWADHYETVWVICGPLISKGKGKLWIGEEGLIRGDGIIFIIFQTGAGEDCKVIGRTWGTPGDWVVCYRDWYW